MKIPNFTKHTMHNYRLVVFFLLLLIGAGVVSMWKMPKQEFPEFKTCIGMVVAVYPGASAEEVEKQLTDKLEEYLLSFSEIKAEDMYSTSRDGIAMVRVLLNDEGAKDPNAVWGRIRDGLPLFQKTMLPAGVLGVAVLDRFGDAAAELIVLDSKDKTYRELDDYASKLKSELQGVENITNLRKQGVLHEQIGIYLDKERMVRYGVNSTMINAMLALQGLTTGGAHLGNDDVDLPIYVTPNYETERELADQIIISDPTGKIVRLKDVARVVREYPEVKSYITNNGNRAVLLSMEMRNGGDIISYGKQVDEKLAEFQKTLPPGVNVTHIANQPKVVQDSINGFFGDFIEAIIIVLIVMVLLFPIRSALVASISIPVTIIITIGAMNVCNIPLSTVTLASLTVALGMVVDDSIIIIDAHQKMQREGHSRWYSAVMSAHTFFPSICVATLSICLVLLPSPMFMPKLFSTFIEVFIYTLSISLMVSLFVAMVVAPMLNFKFLGKTRSNMSDIKESRLLAPVQWAYEKVMVKSFHHPWITIALCAATVVGGVMLFRGIPQHMVPNADRDQFVVEIHNPNGTSIDRTAAITDSVAMVLQKDPRVENVTEFVGQLMPRFMASAPIAIGSKSFSQMIIRSKGNAETLDLIRDYTGYFESRWPETYVRMFQLSYSMASGVSIMLKSDNLDHLHAAADSVKHYLRSLDGTIWVHDCFGEKQPVARIDLDHITAAQLGVTRTSVEAKMAMKYGGFKAGTIWDKDYEMPVMLYTADRNSQRDAGGIGDEYIGTALGRNTPLRQIANITPDWRESTIAHIQGQRCVTIDTDVKPGYSQALVAKKVKEYVNKDLIKKLPVDVKTKTWGADRINQQIAEPLAKSFVVSLCVILLVMVLNFKHFRLAALAMSGTLLAVPGAAIGMKLSGVDFSMMSMLGVFSLLGIVMRNAVIMFDYAEELRRKGKSVRDAAMEAGRRRMIPIVLTSATTAFGVVPLMFSKSTLWPSMGWVICFGTITATILVVIVMPCAYWKLMARRGSK